MDCSIRCRALVGVVFSLLLLAAPVGAAEAPSAAGTPAPSFEPQYAQEPPVVALDADGNLRIWAADFLHTMVRPASRCDEGGDPAMEWLVSEDERRAFEQARARGAVLPASSTGYDTCQCSLTGVSYTAQTCAPDCGNDCDEGHDGTTCHVHEYYSFGFGYYSTFIDDFVDCCECSSSTTNDCGNFVATNNCGGCSSSPWYCPGSGGFASCCVSSSWSFVRQRSRSSTHSVGTKYFNIHRGVTSGTRSNQLRIRQGGRENCNGGSRDGWQTYSFPPDRDVSTVTVGSKLTYSWPCGASLPTLSGSGFSCSCLQATSQCDADGFCDAANANSDPDCAVCDLIDGICTPGCENYFPDPDCASNCEDPTQIDCELF